MRNTTSGPDGRWAGRRSTLGWVLLALVLMAQAHPAAAANRRFLVILANPPKTFADNGGNPPAGFANPVDVNSQYFDVNPNNNIFSFAEWWDEVSYGAVTVNGDTVGWINLPWPIEPPDAQRSPANHINLDFDGQYSYGVGEPFAESPMHVFSDCRDGICDGVMVDYNGDAVAFLGTPLDAYPTGAVFDVEECACCDEDGSCAVLPDDGCTDNQVANLPCVKGECCLPTGCESLASMTVAQCIALGGFPMLDDFPPCMTACASPTLPQPCWEVRFPPLGANGLPWVDTNGVPSRGPVGNLARGPNIPSLPLDDDIYTPGERFRDVFGGEGVRYSALFEPMREDGSDPRCEFDLDGDSRDYLDWDLDSSFDIPEPFEDFLVRWDPMAWNGQGDWVKIETDNPSAGITLEDNYITRNYPLNTNWKLNDPTNPSDKRFNQIDFWLSQPELGGYDTEYTHPGNPHRRCDVEHPDPEPLRPSADAECIYLKQEMYRLRKILDNGSYVSLGSFTGNVNSSFVLRHDLIERWTNVHEMVWRTGNGVYDPPERFRDAGGGGIGAISTVSTKMQHVPENAVPWTTETPRPGSGVEPSLDTVNWYDGAAKFWRLRYGSDPPDWAKGVTGPNSPRMVPFDPENPSPNFDGDDADYEAGERRLWADAGRPDEERDNHEHPWPMAVEPDTTIGFYDGAVEHDDLASSKYHAFGDQRFGEVTSPYSGFEDLENIGGIAGLDRGTHVPDGALAPDNITPAAGPLATDVHGNNRLDAGNLLMLEYMTWRTDINPSADALTGGWAWGDAWDWDGTLLNDGRQPHPYAGPLLGLGPEREGVGFRDFNLDGLVDQGEVRPAGSENYVVDSDPDTTNDGTDSRYPFNRRRLLEDCIAIIDDAVDFDLWHDVVSPYYGDDQPTKAAGILSGIVLLPRGAISDHSVTFPLSGDFYPIHTDDRPADRPTAVFRRRFGDPERLPLFGGDAGNAYYSGLWFHDLVAGLDRGAVSGGGSAGASGSGGGLFQMRYAAHEYGHTWEGYPDLYDFRRLNDVPAETFPIGQWGVMADGDSASGYPVHPVAHLKDEDFSGWVHPVDLATVLSPGIAQEITLPDSERSNSNTYYFYENPLRTVDPEDPDNTKRELFYFWRAGFAGQFDVEMPGAGVLILHTDVEDNPDAIPPQQQLDPYSWYIVQADGNNDLDTALPAGNSGDNGDPWPGSSNNPAWHYSSVPNNRWHGEGFSGIDILNMIETPTGTRVTFRWTPIEIPVLFFNDPPAVMSGNDGLVSFWSYDQFAGTEITLYYDKDDEGYDGTAIGDPVHKTTGTILEPGSLEWPLVDSEGDALNGLHYLYAKLDPRSTENPFSTVRASRDNKGDGTLTLEGVGDKVKLEAWTVTYEHDPEDDFDSDLSWKVVGSVSPEQARAITGVRYTTTGGEVSFKIVGEEASPFKRGDRFVFVTTGLTPYAGPVNIVNGAITDMPIADISRCGNCVEPTDGLAPLVVEFDGRFSDPNGARGLVYEWDFGEGDGFAPGGAQVSHTYERPGIFVAELKVIDIDDPDKFDTDQRGITVQNGEPTAKIVMVAVTPENEFPVTMQFFGDESTDPEDLPLDYRWVITWLDKESTWTVANPPELTFGEDPDNPGEPYAVEVELTVTDSQGAIDTDTNGFFPGNTTPVARIKVLTPTSGTVPYPVKVDASDSTDPDTNQTLTYKWDFDDSGSTGNTITTAEASHEYEKVGTYTIKLTVDDGITDDSATIKVVARDPAVVGDIPTAILSADPTSGDMPLDVDFDGSGSSDPQNGTLTFLWTFGDGEIAGDVEKTTHTYTEAGEFTAVLKVVDPDGNADEASKKIKVTDPNAPPDNEAPLASFNAKPTAGPAPLTVDFESTAFDPDGDNLSQFWDFGDAGDDDTASGTEASYTYRSPGTYTVKLTVVDPDDFIDEATTSITVEGSLNDLPTARIATYPAVVTAPDQVDFDATLSSDEDGDELTFTWEISSEETLIDFGDTLAGAVLTVSFRNTLAECNALVGPCLTPGAYSLVVIADDGRGGTATSDPASIEVRGGAGGLLISDTGEEGQQVPAGERTLTGSSRVSDGGVCGLGVLTPMLLLTLTLSAWLVTRRRQ